MVSSPTATRHLTLAAAAAGVVGLSNVGGLVGQSGGLIEGSHSDVAVFGTGNNLGGLVGYVGAGSISDSYATGTVINDPSSFTMNVGGLVGQVSPA